MVTIDQLPRLQDDNLPVLEIRSWALRKYARFTTFSEIFTSGMREKYDRRVYVDLFSGPGRSRIKSTGEIVRGSPLIALMLRDPFDDYVFCEKKANRLAALQRRVERLAVDRDLTGNVNYVLGDANEKVDEILEHVPETGKVLSLCFSDPYSLGPNFTTIQALASGRRMDFLSTLMVPLDANLNWQRYLEPGHTTISRWLGDETWRNTWREAKEEGWHPSYFLARQYAESLANIGYCQTPPDLMDVVRSDKKNLPLYYLTCFSKHPLGLKFWRESLKYSTNQREFSFDEQQ